ncbi:histidine kinase OS=Streptomyces microflavus OX=1919 GN=G3I39_30805 PE=4 SV=1 [Streptomyces microflavus]
MVLAELLADTTDYSAPGTPVEINIQAVPTGVCLIVDDAGLGMGQEEKDRAAALLSPQAAISVSSLGIPPQFGFAVSGMLAASYGFRVSVDSVSPYGGVRAVVLIPDELLTTEVPQPAAPAEAPETCERLRHPAGAGGRAARPVAAGAPHRRPPRSSRRRTGVRTPPRSSSPQITTTSGGLPKRRRKSPLSAVPRPRRSQTRGNEETASRLGASRRGARSGRDATTTEGSEIQ